MESSPLTRGKEHSVASMGHRSGHCGHTGIEVGCAKVVASLDLGCRRYWLSLCGPSSHPGVEPTKETTNRKPLRQPAAFGGSWEIRFGPDNRFRVLYDVDQEPRVIQILAIGEKPRERSFIGGEEVQL
jgi:hypothetical protein